MSKPFILFKPFKFLFKLIGALILIAIIIPIVMIVLMYDFSNYQPPRDDLSVVGDNITFASVVQESLDRFLESNDAMAIEVGVSSSEANAMLIWAFRENNPYYLTEDGTGEQQNYATTFGPVKVKGATLTFKEDILVVESGIDSSLIGFTYRTKIYLEFKITESEEGFYLQINKVNIGSLPIKPIYGFANWVLGLAGINIKEFVGEAIPIGSVNADDLSATITYQEIFALLKDENNDNTMLDVLTALMEQRFGTEEKRIFEIGFNDNKAGIDVNLGLIRTNQEGYNLVNKITSEEQLNQLFRGQVSNLLISGLNSNPGQLHLDLQEVVVNQMLDYYVKDSMSVAEEFVLNEQSYYLKTEPIFIELINDEVHFKIILSIENSDALSSFRTMFDFSADVKMADNQTDLVFDIIDVSIGDDSVLSDQLVDIALSLIGTNDIIDGRQIILKDFVTSILNSGVVIDDVYVLGSFIRFVVSPEDQELQDVINSINEHIGDILNNVTANPDYQVVADALADYEDTDEIVDAINQLEPELQQQLYQDILDSFADEEVDLSELLAMLAQ